MSFTSVTKVEFMRSTSWLFMIRLYYSDNEFYSIGLNTSGMSVYHFLNGNITPIGQVLYT